MTVREAIVDLWELAGEPSDLDPWALNAVTYDPFTELDPTSKGVRHYLYKLSMAQIALANWRTSKGRPIRFKKFLTRKNVVLGLRNQDYTLTKIDEYTMRFTNLPSYIEPQMLEGASLIISYTGGLDETFEENVQIVLADQNGVNVDVQFQEPLEEPTFTPLTTTGSIYFDRFEVRKEDTRPADASYLSLPSSFRNILKILTLADSGEIYRADSKEALDNSQLTIGTPSNWYNIGDVLYFDSYLEEPTWFVIEYQRLPHKLTDLDQAFDIPEEWHDVIMLIVEWTTAKRLQENEKSQVLLSEVNRWIGTLRTDYEEDWLREDTNGIKIQREARS